MKQHTHFPPLDAHSLPIVSAALKAVGESDKRMNGYGAKQRGDLESAARSMARKRCNTYNTFIRYAANAYGG